MMPRALMLIVGLLIGSSAVYFSGVRRQAPPAVASNGPSTTLPAAGELPSTPADTLGTAPDTTDRPVPPGVPRERAAKPSPAPAVTPPPPARTGTLVVRSTPPGAAVTINGKWSGRTPTHSSLAFGDYTVRVLLPGYQTKPEQVTLSADAATRTLAVQLQRERPAAAATPSRTQPSIPAPPAATAKPAPESTAAATGSLEVDSRPVGARVFVDDQPFGTTPVRLPEVTPGSHVVRLELANHQVWTEVAQVGRGKTTRVAGSLEPIR